MAKGQTSYGTNIANNVNNAAQTQFNPSIDFSRADQQNNANRASDTYGIAAPTYANFAQTGGFSPTDETTYLNRATQGVAGTYDILGQNAARARAASGGLGTGGEIGQLARQGTQAQAQATEGAQADLHTMENANKLAGAAGLSHLYDTSTNQVTAQGAQILQALGLKFNTQLEAGQLLEKLSKDPTTFMQWLKSIGGAAGTVAGLAGGLSGLGGGGAASIGGGPGIDTGSGGLQ